MPETKIPNGRKPRGEWISMEAFDSEGQPILPPDAVRSTVNVKFDQTRHTDLDLRIITGVAPQGGLIGQYKIYNISRFSMRGWRIEARATVELNPLRGYEKAWFEAYNGRRVVISHPGLPGTLSEEFRTKIIESNFQKKEITSYSKRGSANRKTKVYEGNLRMHETWLSALLRRRGQALSYIIATTIGAIVGAIVTGLI